MMTMPHWRMDEHRFPHAALVGDVRRNPARPTASTTRSHRTLVRAQARRGQVLQFNRRMSMYSRAMSIPLGHK